MAEDVFGVVKLEQIERAVKRDALDENYNSLLFDRFLQQQMKNLARFGTCDIEGVITALALFGIGYAHTLHMQGEKKAYIDRRNCTVSWFEYIYVPSKSEPVSRKTITYRTGSVDVEIKPIKRKPSNRRRYSDLSPELQEKIKNRYPEKFK